MACRSGLLLSQPHPVQVGRLPHLVFTDELQLPRPFLSYCCYSRWTLDHSVPQPGCSVCPFTPLGFPSLLLSSHSHGPILHLVRHKAALPSNPKSHFPSQSPASCPSFALRGLPLCSSSRSLPQLCEVAAALREETALSLPPTQPFHPFFCQGSASIFLTQALHPSASSALALMTCFLLGEEAGGDSFA